MIDDESVIAVAARDALLEEADGQRIIEASSGNGVAFEVGEGKAGPGQAGSPQVEIDGGRLAGQVGCQTDEEAAPTIGGIEARTDIHPVVTVAGVDHVIAAAGLDDIVARSGGDVEALDRRKADPVATVVTIASAVAAAS